MTALPSRSTPGTAAPPLVEVRKLVVVRGARPVLTIDELAVGNRETLSVVGPNGAGKSTLILALARLVRPARGQLLFRGVPVEPRDELGYRRRIGLVLPDPLLLDTSVSANVAAGLRFRGISSTQARPRVAEWLAGRPARSRPARPSASAWPGRSCLNPTFSCSTSRSRRSIPRPARSWSTTSSSSCGRRTSHA